jgi:CRISPR-associated protein Csm3
MAHIIQKYRIIKGTLHCETGLRIGGSKENIEIGGLENTIIRHPITDEPYIPGSSLKGKVRSLLEYKFDRRDSQNRPKGKTDGEPCQCGRCQICRVFGPHKNTRHELGPTRVLFRDAGLTAAAREWLQEAQTTRGLFYAEVKTENMIDRNIGVAEHPRTQERVPAGASFDFEISIRIFEGDNEEEIVGFVKSGLDLLQQDYLGASGSRGYGKVRLEYQVL